MKICHTCRQTYSDTNDFCPREGVRHNAVAAVGARPGAGSDRRPAIRDRRYNRRTEDLPL